MKAFQAESQIYEQDNPLQDCFKFFHKASQLFKFEDVFLRKYHELLFFMKAQEMDDSQLIGYSPSIPFKIPVSQIGTNHNSTVQH